MEKLNCIKAKLIKKLVSAITNHDIKGTVSASQDIYSYITHKTKQFTSTLSLNEIEQFVRGTFKEVDLSIKSSSNLPEKDVYVVQQPLRSTIHSDLDTAVRNVKNILNYNKHNITDPHTMFMIDEELRILTNMLSKNNPIYVMNEHLESHIGSLSLYKARVEQATNKT